MEPAVVEPAAPVAAPAKVIPRSARFLFAGGGAMVFGAFAPWVTFFVLNISGVDANYGIVTLLAGAVCCVAAYEIWKGGLFGQVGRRTVVVAALVAALAGVAAPIYVAAEAKQPVAGARFGSGTFGVPSTPSFPGRTQIPGFNNGLGQLSSSLANALRPQIGFGVWLSILGGLVAVAGAFDQLRKNDDPQPWA